MGDLEGRVIDGKGCLHMRHSLCPPETLLDVVPALSKSTSDVSISLRLENTADKVLPMFFARPIRVHLVTAMT